MVLEGRHGTKSRVSPTVVTRITSLVNSLTDADHLIHWKPTDCVLATLLSYCGCTDSILVETAPPLLWQWNNQPLVYIVWLVLLSLIIIASTLMRLNYYRIASLISTRELCTFL